MDDEKTTIQVARLAIVKPPFGTAARWRDLAVSVQRMRNLIMRLWYRWHEDQGHCEAVYEWMNALRAWHREKQRLEEAAKPAEKPTTAKEKRLAREAKGVLKKLGSKPTCPASPYPKAVYDLIYPAIGRAFGDLPAQTRATAMRALMDTWKKTPSSKGAFKKWQCALAGFGEFAVFSHGEAIPLHNQHIRLIPPTAPDDDWRVGLKVAREEVNGKGVNPEDVVIVQTKGRKCRKLRLALEACAEGRFKHGGSDLVIRKGRWYLHLVYKQPVPSPPELDAAMVAVLEPAVDHPWSLHVNGRDDWLVGKNRLLEWHRRRLRRERSVQREAYREGSQGKGHGRAKFFGDPRFRNRLAGYKKVLAQVSVARAIAACIRHGAGTLIYHDPTERNKGQTFLQTVGASRKRPDTFPWFIVKSKLERDCEKAGIVLEVEPWQGVETNG